MGLISRRLSPCLHTSGSKKEGASHYTLDLLMLMLMLMLMQAN
jgi:hypothetical protein